MSEIRFKSPKVLTGDTKMWRHIYPMNDVIEHELEKNPAEHPEELCQCNPVIDYDHCLVIHDAFDGRD